MYKTPSFKNGVMMSVWCAVTPALILLERTYDVSWPLVVVTGFINWACALLFIVALLVMRRVLEDGTNYDIYELAVSVESATVNYSMLTHIMSLVLSFVVIAVLTAGGHTVLALGGFISLILAILIHINRLELMKRMYAMSWEERGTYKQLHDSLKSRRAQLNARIAAVADSDQ